MLRREEPEDFSSLVQEDRKGPSSGLGDPITTNNGREATGGTTEVLSKGSSSSIPSSPSHRLTNHERRGEAQDAEDKHQPSHGVGADGGAQQGSATSASPQADVSSSSSAEGAHPVQTPSSPSPSSPADSPRPQVDPTPPPEVGSASGVAGHDEADVATMFVQLLPPALQMQVLVHLRVRDVCRLALVCRSFFVLISSDDFWRRFHAQRFDPMESAALPSPFSASYRSTHDSSSPRGPSAATIMPASKWRDDFKVRFERARGWRRTNYREVAMRGHQHAVTAVRMWTASDRLFSASADSTIRAWNLTSGRNLGVLRGHAGAILCLDRNDSYLSTGSEDKSIKIWDLSQGKVVRNMTVHKASVLCLQMDNTKYISGSVDGSIRLCDLRKKEPERISFHHNCKVVRCLQFDDNCLVVGTEMGTIRVLDLSTGKCMQTLGEHLRAVTCVRLDERRLISGSVDWSARIWDRASGQCMEELEEHMNGVFSIKVDRQKLITGGGDHLIKVWDFDDDLWCINTLRGHSGRVLSLDADDTRLVSGSADQTVRLWDWSDPDYAPPPAGSEPSSVTSLSGALTAAANGKSSEECLLQ